MIYLEMMKGKRTSIPEEWLTSVSHYFAEAFSTGFEQPKDRVITLKDIQTKTLTMFVNWLNSGLLDRPNGEFFYIDSTSSTGARTHDEDMDILAMDEELLDIYIFADMYDVPQLRRDALSTMIDLQTSPHSGLSTASCISRAYKALPHDSPIIRYFVDSYAFSWDGDYEGEEKHMFPPEFLAALLEKIMQAPKRYITRNPFRHVCDYHEHVHEKETQAATSEAEDSAFHGVATRRPRLRSAARASKTQRH